MSFNENIYIMPIHPVESEKELERSTQPCIPPGSLNRVPASAGVKAGKSPLPDGSVISYGM